MASAEARADTDGMVVRAGPVAVIHAEAPPALSFLTEAWGFAGPELTDDGVAHHRPGLHVHIAYWAWKNERGFMTTLTRTAGDGTTQRAQLGALYVACGLGAAQDVPEGAGSLHVISKRIRQHAKALRTLMLHLDRASTEALFTRPDHGGGTASGRK